MFLLTQNIALSKSDLAGIDDSQCHLLPKLRRERRGNKVQIMKYESKKKPLYQGPFSGAFTQGFERTQHLQGLDCNALA
jgi:hypothetical protein